MGQTTLQHQTVSKLLRGLCKDHHLKLSPWKGIQVKKSGLRFLFDANWACLTPEATKKLEILNKQIPADNWAARDAAIQELVTTDRVKPRVLAFLLDLQATLSSQEDLNLELGHVLPVRGTSGYGSYEGRKHFQFYKLADITFKERVLPRPGFTFLFCSSTGWLEDLEYELRWSSPASPKVR